MVHDLDQLHQMNRVEEVHAHHPALIAHGGGDVGDRQRRGVAREQRVRRDDRVDRSKDLALELEVLGDRLDHAVDAAARRRELVECGDARQRSIAVRRLHLAELDALVEVVRDLGNARPGGTLQHIVEMYACAHRRGDMCDAVAHRARPDHRVMVRSSSEGNARRGRRSPRSAWCRVTG
jgi:hypothetical protein